MLSDLQLKRLDKLPTFYHMLAKFSSNADQILVSTRQCCHKQVSLFAEKNDWLINTIHENVTKKS